MKQDIVNLIDKNLLIILQDLSISDIIIQKTLQKTGSVSEFINALISCIICVKDREDRNQSIVHDLLAGNSKIQEMMKERDALKTGP